MTMPPVALTPPPVLPKGGSLIADTVAPTAETMVPMNIFDMIKGTAPAPLSKEVQGGVDIDTEFAQQGATSAEQELLDLDLPPLTPEIEQCLTTLYGPDFPLIKTDPPTDGDWCSWVNNRWVELAPTVQRRLWLVERNRLFRNNIQWVSSSGYGPWREPPRPRDSARIVENVIKPALDQRLQILSEQRPGFRVNPTTNDPKDKAKAEAKQYALEYQYTQQQMELIIKEAGYWAGTDGVSFIELYWDPDAGPWTEALYGQTPGPGSSDAGAAGMAGSPTAPPSGLGGAAPGAPPDPGAGMPGAAAPRSEPQGDVKCRVRRIEQVRVSANATGSRPPWFWIIKDVMSKQEAIRIYGVDIAKTPGGVADPSTSMLSNYPQIRLGFQMPNIDELLLEQDKVLRYTVYVEKSLGLPKGLTLVVVGDKLVFQGPLAIGKAPMVRWTDGSTDPAFFCGAEMEGWIDSQMRINAVKSKWVENVRMNAGVKLLAKENAVSPETFTGANMSIISAKGLGPLNDIVRPIEGFTVGNDAKELLALERKQFEDLTGWNQVSRGQVDSEQSGRAILAIREQLERIFAPGINAAARSMTEWAKLSCGYMAWGYDYPRMLGVEGRGRPDLARVVMSEDMDGVAEIFIDPETLMPMPRPLRLFLLGDMLSKGLMTPQEYRRRMPFAYLKDLESPDEDQEARAKRVCEGLRNGQVLPLLWQDNEAIHQDVLERQLILPDDTVPEVRLLAQQRWIMLAQQSQMKMGIMPGTPMGAGPQGPGAPGASQPGPGQQPFASTNPGIAAKQSGMGDDQKAGQAFDAQQRALDQG